MYCYLVSATETTVVFHSCYAAYALSSAAHDLSDIQYFFSFLNPHP